MTLVRRSWIGRGNDAATLTFPFGIEATYYEKGEWGTVYLCKKLRIAWNFKRGCRELFVTRNGTPWGIPRLLGRVLYVGRVLGKWSVLPDADAYALKRYHRPYVVMRGWVKRPDNED